MKNLHYHQKSVTVSLACQTLPIHQRHNLLLLVWGENTAQFTEHLIRVWSHGVVWLFDLFFVLDFGEGVGVFDCIAALGDVHGVGGQLGLGGLIFGVGEFALLGEELGVVRWF